MATIPLRTTSEPAAVRKELAAAVRATYSIFVAFGSLTPCFAVKALACTTTGRRLGACC